MKIKIGDIENKAIWGRTCYADGALCVYHAGSGLELRVAARELYAEIEAEYELSEIWIDVIIDGERSIRQPLRRGRHSYQIFRGLSPDTPAEVLIARDTQFIPEDRASVMHIVSIETDGDILAVRPRRHSLEFIGDSITSGEGCGLTRREEWEPLVFDAYESYPRYTAAALDARYSVLSQSGWGLYASWDADTSHALPVVYPYVCGARYAGATEPKSNLATSEFDATGATAGWDFASDNVDAIIINLGTNDGSARTMGEWSTSEYDKLFIDCGVNFLHTIRTLRPDAHIVWAYGMLGREMRGQIERAVGIYREQSCDENVGFLLLSDSSGRYMGARNHPSPEGHREAAEVLTKYLRDVLG